MKTIILLLSLFLAKDACSQLVSHKLKMHSRDTQCVDSNNFCFTDSIYPVSTSRLARATYLFSDGYKHELLNPLTGPLDFCHSFQDPAGGRYTLTLELEDTQGFIIKQTYQYMTTVVCNTGLKSPELTKRFGISPGPEQGSWMLSGEGLAGIKPELTDISGRRIAYRSNLIHAGLLQIWIEAPGWYILSNTQNGRLLFREKLLR